MRASAVSLVSAPAAWCCGGVGACVFHVVRLFLFCFYALGSCECVKAGCEFFLAVRRIYIIIICRRGMYCCCIFRCRGCRRLSEPTVVCRFFHFDVRDARRRRTSGCLGFVIRRLRLVGTCCVIGFIGSGVRGCSAYYGFFKCYFVTFIGFSLTSMQPG